MTIETLIHEAQGTSEEILDKVIRYLKYLKRKLQKGMRRNLRDKSGDLMESIGVKSKCPRISMLPSMVSRSICNADP